MSFKTTSHFVSFLAVTANDHLGLNLHVGKKYPRTSKMFLKFFDEETSEGGEAFKAYQNKFVIHNTATTYFCHVLCEAYSDWIELWRVYLESDQDFCLQCE